MRCIVLCWSFFQPITVKRLKTRKYHDYVDLNFDSCSFAFYYYNEMKTHTHHTCHCFLFFSFYIYILVGPFLFFLPLPTSLSLSPKISACMCGYPSVFHKIIAILAEWIHSKFDACMVHLPKGKRNILMFTLTLMGHKHTKKMI